MQYKDTLMYVDPITRQTYDFATPIPCDTNPRNIIELDPDTDVQDFYILCPESVERELFCLQLLKSKLARRPNTLTPQDAGVYSNAELDQFRNRILFFQKNLIQHFNYSEKLSYSFISSITPDYSDAHIVQTNPYKTLRNILQDKLFNLTPLFTPSRFADVFITLFGYPCYLLTQCGKYFSTFLFIQEPF